MKKIICTFDITKDDQIIYIIDSEDNEKVFAGLTVLDNLPLALASMAQDTLIDNIIIEGDLNYGITLKEAILQETNNNNFIVNVEVL